MLMNLNVLSFISKNVYLFDLIPFEFNSSEVKTLQKNHWNVVLICLCEEEGTIESGIRNLALKIQMK